MKNFLSTLLVLIVLVTPVEGKAQDNPKDSSRLTHEQIDEIGRQVHAYMPNAKIGNDELIGEERAKTLKYPLVPYDLMEFVIVRGTLAGFAAHCGLDWEEKFYMPLMQGLRAKQTSFNDYQWAFVGLLHGAAMGSAEQSMKGEPCEENMKQNLLGAALK